MFGATNKPAFGTTGFSTQTSGGVFGSSNTSFGSTGGGFGTSGLFSSQTPGSSTGGLFGTTTTQSGGLFGAGSSTFGQSTLGGGFGGQQPTGMFGSSGQQTSSLFSTPGSSTSTAFGAKTPAATGFGSAAQSSTFGSSGGQMTSLFGGGNPAGSGTAGSLFGSTTSTSFTAQSGTTVKFNPPPGQDTMLKGGTSTNISTRHQCITAMKEYESKSLEELRMEDYLANRKGPQMGATGLFANPQTTQAQTGFSFGTQNKTTGFGGFGQTTSGTSLFGQQTQSGGLFGSAGSKTFGTTTTTASTGFGGFGSGTSIFDQNTANKSIFGQPTSTQSGGLFGSTQTGSTSFGGFGSTQTGFGTSTTGGLFGSKPTSFAQPTTNTGLTFGPQNQLSTGGLFGSKPAGQTGQSTATGFGTTGGLFGNKPTGFGTGTSTLGSTAFGQTSTGFGSNFSTGLFSGTQNKPTLGGLGTGFGFNFNNPGQTQNTTNSNFLSHSVTQNQDSEVLEQLRKTLIYSPYGDSPLFRNLQNDTASQEDLLKPTNPIAQKAALASEQQYKVSPTSTTRIKPKPLTITSDKTQLFDGLEDEDLTFDSVTFVPRRSIKKLNIKSNGSLSKHSSHLEGTGFETSQKMSTPQKSEHVETDREQESSVLKTTTDDGDSAGSGSLPPTLEKQTHGGLFQNISGSFLDDTISELNPKNKHDASQDSTTNTNKDVGAVDDVNEQPAEPHPAGIVLRRHGYYTLPPLDRLADMVGSNGDCIVNDFLIGREGYGSVLFPGQTNVANLNLDEIVHFRRKEITVYPIDEEKPAEGSGLNKKAQVTLDCVWPCDKNTREYITDPECLKELHYQEKLEKITAKIDAKFLDYRPETGSWVFEVKHFSKYGLIDDDDDEVDHGDQDPKKLAKLKEEQMKHLPVQKQRIKVLPGQKHLTHQKDDRMQQGKPLDEEPDKVDDVPHSYPLLGDEELDEDIMKETTPKEFVEIEETELSARTPASHQLASHLGVMAEDLQLKKASFFGDEDILPKWNDHVTDGRKLPQWTIGQSLLNTSYSKATSRLISPQKSLLPYLQSTPFDVTFRAGEKHDSLFLETVQPFSGVVIKKSKPLTTSQLKRRILPLNKSLLQNKLDLVMDLGLINAKRFRVGWGPHWNLVHGGKAIMKEQEPLKSVDEYPEPHRLILLEEKSYAEKFKLCTDDQQLLMEQLIISPLQQTTQSVTILHQAVIDQMTVQLQHTQISTESGFPQAVCLPGNKIIEPLISCTENALKGLGDSADCNLYRQALLVWELCQALWGDLSDLTEDVKRDSYAYNIARQQALSEWLEKAVASTVHQEIEQIQAKCDSRASEIFLHLTGHQLEEACDVAQQTGDHQIALLISQASGMSDLCNYVQCQLMMWEQSQMDEFIMPNRLKIYALLAGTMVWKTSEDHVINVCEGLDWKRAMAVHLWYQCQPTCTVQESLRAYCEGFQSEAGNGYAAPPLPPYLEATAESDDKQDVCYQLIQLFCDRAHPLNKLLCPTSAIPNCLDYRLSWQLSQVLQALEYTHLSEYHAAMLCTSFAAQLECMKLWHWAVFVLLHIPGDRDREHAVFQLLQRHISLHPDDEEKQQEQFLQDVLKIPAKWIHQAKAIIAGHLNEKDEEAWHWLKAGHWNKAHQLILNHLASRAIVNENFADLKCLLSEIGSPEISCTVEDWDIGGRVFLDYIIMMETLQQLQQSEPSANELDKLQSEVCQLSRCITGLKCHSATDRLCQSEMAKRAANLMRTLLQMKVEGDDINEMLVAETTDLPLPEDYALQELHQLTRCYLIGVARS